MAPASSTAWNVDEPEAESDDGVDDDGTEADECDLFEEEGDVDVEEQPTALERMRDLKGLLDDGFITQQEFEQKRAQILEQL